jgi:hypothetical protein
MFGRYGIEAPLRGPEVSTPTFASSGNLIADRRYAFGRELAARGDLAAAADLFAQAAEAEPAFTAAWFALGETAVKRGDRWIRRTAVAQPCTSRSSAPPIRRRRCRAPMCARCSTNTRRASTVRSKRSPIAGRSSSSTP